MEYIKKYWKIGLLIIVLVTVTFIELMALDKLSHKYFDNKHKEKNVICNREFTYVDDGITGWGDEVIDLSEYFKDKDEITIEISTYANLFNFKELAIAKIEPIESIDEDGEPRIVLDDSITEVIGHNETRKIKLNKDVYGEKVMFSVVSTGRANTWDSYIILKEDK